MERRQGADTSASARASSRPAGGRGYLPLREYALLGDMRTAALVARDGAVDWYCLPRFDGPAVLCRLLDAQRGGFFRVGPTGRFHASRR